MFSFSPLQQGASNPKDVVMLCQATVAILDVVQAFAIAASP
jgi:hypothetical protein